MTLQAGLVGSRRGKIKVMLELHVHSVGYDPLSDSPVVILCSKDDKREVLPIWMGIPEAMAIMVALSGEAASRPLSADLLFSTISVLDATLSRAEIVDLEESTFIARLVILDINNKENELDCRPSDLIALALRTGTPIRIDDGLFERCKLTAPSHDVEVVEITGEEVTESDVEDDVASFRRFLSEVAPEDFLRDQ
jgi:hypothetical protein